MENNNIVIPEESGLEIKDNKEIIVPGNIRFISDWKEYSLYWFQFPHILDKKIPGCGYTEYCIKTYLPIILCSPRKMLLENKTEQHPEVFYFKNELDKEIETDKDLTKITRTSELLEEISIDEEAKKQEAYDSLRDSLLQYTRNCFSNFKAPKILVTYDSFRLVKEILQKEGVFDSFYTVVDEFQSIFTDSRFKSSTEMEFVSQLQDLQRVCFVSATPMIDKYLAKLVNFKDLPYYEFNWSEKNPLRVVKPDLKVRVVSSITSKAKEIIETYKNGKFDTYIKKNESGDIEVVESKEAVFYVNSVNNIISIISKSELDPSECNILCARTDTNIKKVRKRLGSKFSIGKVPLKGEDHKMFTFCTRTVYLGADFYSTNARSFIFSDANIDCLAVDISLDLPQILGRQRDLSNPWKNRAEFYYKTLGKKNELTEDAFKRIVDDKKKTTSDLIEAYKSCKESAKQSLAKTFQYVAKSANYKDNYVAVNEHSGKNLVPVINDLVIVAEERAFDIQQIDYKDRFSVFNTISDGGLFKIDTTNKINDFLNRFNSLSLFSDKMRLLCESSLTDQERGVILDQIPLTYKNYYETLEPERCYALGYNKTYINQAYSDLQFNKDNLKIEIYKVFKEGNKYSRSSVKETLGNIYETLGYNKSPKANDLEEYFDIKTCKVFDSTTGKRDNGFEIIKKKEK